MLSHVFLLKVFMNRMFCVYVFFFFFFSSGGIYAATRSVIWLVYWFTINKVFLGHTNHSVCLKPAAVMERKTTVNVGKMCKIPKLWPTWVIRCLTDATNDLFTLLDGAGSEHHAAEACWRRGFWGVSVKRKPITRESHLGPANCNRAVTARVVASPCDWGGWLQPTASWQQQGWAGKNLRLDRTEWCLLQKIKNEMLTPRRMQILCNLVDQISRHRKSLDSDARKVPEERWRSSYYWTYYVQQTLKYVHILLFWQFISKTHSPKTKKHNYHSCSPVCCSFLCRSNVSPSNPEAPPAGHMTAPDANVDIIWECGGNIAPGERTGFSYLTGQVFLQHLGNSMLQHFLVSVLGNDKSRCNVCHESFTMNWILKQTIWLVTIPILVFPKNCTMYTILLRRGGSVSLGRTHSFNHL